MGIDTKHRSLFDMASIPHAQRRSGMRVGVVDRLDEEGVEGLHVAEPEPGGELLLRQEEGEPVGVVCPHLRKGKICDVEPLWPHF